MLEFSMNFLLENIDYDKLKIRKYAEKKMLRINLSYAFIVLFIRIILIFLLFKTLPKVPYFRKKNHNFILVVEA